MPTDRIRVERVDRTETQNGLPRWLVTGVYADGRLGGFQATTISPFAASLCRRAAETGDEADIQWRDVRFGRAISYVTYPVVDEGTAA